MMLGMPQLYEFDNIEDNLKLAKELNLDFIELNLNFGYCRKEMEAKTVKALLDKYNIKATLHFYDEADLASYDEVVEAFQSDATKKVFDETYGGYFINVGWDQDLLADYK